MISNHTTQIDQKRQSAAYLSAQIAQFLAAGGHIEVAEPYHYKPRPITYSNQMPPAPKPFVRRKVVPPPAPPTAADIRHQERMKLVEQIRQMAATHTQSEIVEALGINRRKIYDIAQGHDLKFKRPTRGGAHDPHRSDAMKARDAKLAERIRAFLELGITRRQACGKLAIASKTFQRILEEHGIDYPKARRGST